MSYKYIQRKLYDILTSRNGVLTLIFCTILFSSSLFFFGEAVVEWSSEKYAAVFNSYSDNLLSKSFRTRLCLPVPIDVVYTWVNGTDPKLLSDLRSAKGEIEQEMKNSKKPTSPGRCVYANCVKALIAVFPQALPDEINKENLSLYSSALSAAYKLYSTSTDDLRTNISILHFLNQQDVDKALNSSITLRSSTHTAVQGYFTSDVTLPKSKKQSNVVLISGFKKDYTSEEVMQMLPKHVTDKIYNMDVIGRVGLIRTATAGDAEALIALAFNFTIDRRYLQLSYANLVFDLDYSGKEMDLSPSRFEDNEELRYSLRSLEQFAPWVRHIYLVTNGQIPYWLNIDHPRITIVTHEEIFENKSHLPTFSSPAIESNIHRIQGLSSKFLYLNDDVMFAMQVWPDDFYTHSNGQKVYLTWPIPDCAPGCPQSWLKDGYCDRACNVSECSFDAGDCAGGVPAFNAGVWRGSNQRSAIESSVCNVGCSNTWIADKYCDQACNTKDCAFDAGDCGTSNYNQLHGEFLQSSVSEYLIPPGVTEAFFNFSSLSQLKVSHASYENIPIVRTAAVSNKHKMVTVLLLKNHTDASFVVNITFGEKEAALNFSFVVKVNTMPAETTSTTATTTLSTKAAQVAVSPASIVFMDLPELSREPQAVLMPTEKDMVVEDLSANETLLSLEVKEQLKVLEAAYLSGDLTEKGYKKKRNQLLISSNYDSPQDTGHRRLLHFVEQDQEHGFLPWELTDEFKRFIKDRDAFLRETSYLMKPRQQRHLFDTFAQSLHHVNDLYNKMFGVKARKVPGHMPHLVDKQVVDDLHKTFKEQWDMTSSHKIRSGNDMQFAFSYYYFLMDSRRNNTEIDFLEEVDIDNSRVLSDREIRTMATRIFDAPLSLENLQLLENHIINCSKHLPAENLDSATQVESYYTPDMPQVTLYLLSNCEPVLKFIRNKVQPKAKFRYEVMGDSDINFKMIGTNLSTVVGQLDDLRRHPRKFMCLNDNIDHHNPEALQVKALLRDFYESLFPIRSQFELPLDYRNRFLHVDELNKWKMQRDYMKLGIEVLLVLLVLYTIYSFYEDRWKASQERRRTNEHV